MQIEATLVFDSWIDPVDELRRPPVRERHLIYEGGGLVLDLLLKADGESTGIYIGGQMLPGNESFDSVADVRVQIQQGNFRSQTNTNALGEFVFHGIADQSGDLSITLKTLKFVVKGLSLYEPRQWRVSASAEGAR